MCVCVEGVWGLGWVRCRPAAELRRIGFPVSSSPRGFLAWVRNQARTDERYTVVLPHLESNLRGQ